MYAYQPPRNERLKRPDKKHIRKYLKRTEISKINAPLNVKHLIKNRSQN